MFSVFQDENSQHLQLAQKLTFF